MAKNGPKGNGRVGRIKSRSQVLNTKNKRYTERDTKTGKFLNVRFGRGLFKKVRIEK